MPASNPMSGRTMISMMLVLVIMMVVASFRYQIGGALDFVFKYVAFDGKYPVLTLVIAGIIMITLSTVVRSLMQNPIEMARSQQIQSDFNKEFRQARIENNLFKMKKLEEMQPQIMQMSMEMSTKQMKVMPVTMLFVIPVYAWVFYFVQTGADAAYFPGVDELLINMPWGYLNVNDILLFIPAWIVVYTMVSLPIGQIENRLIRYLLLKKRLNELDSEVKEAEIE